MKKRTVSALLLLLAMLLSACAQQAAEPKTTTDVTAVPAFNAQQEQTETVTEVENNGGYYVRVNDKVYFRRYGADALEKTTVFGEFTDSWCITGESEIVALDPASGELAVLFAEEGCGALWYGDGGFYLNERFGGEDSVFWYSLDGSKTERVGAGVPLGMTDSGLLLVRSTENGPDYRSVYTFYREKAAAAQAELPNDLFCSFAGLTDDGAFLVKAAYGEGTELTCELLQITPEGKLINLGALPEPADEGLYDVQADCFAAAGGKVAVGVGYYAGTGHFLAQAVFAEATVGQEASVHELETDIETDEGSLPRLTALENGSVSFAAALPDELRVEYDTGDLLVFKSGEWHTAAEGLLPPQTDGYGYRRLAQHMDYVDGTAYVTLACTHASPQDSIGWRDAFTLLDMLYLAIDGSGAAKELACVDHGAELYGDVWFLGDESTALWRQRRVDAEEEYYVPEYAYAIPVAQSGTDSFPIDFSNGMQGLVDTDCYDEGAAGYYGYPLPDAEPAGTFCLTLDRDGAVTHIANKTPDAVLTIDFDVPESGLEGAAAKLDVERRDGDEDTQGFWSKLTVLEDGVRVRVERSAENMGDVAELARIEGEFIPGETVYDAVLNRGEYVALRASLPWHPELRVSVSKDGGWGSYVFGEDNWKHLWTEESVHPELTLSALPLPDVSESTGEGLSAALDGTWMYRDPETGEITATLRFDPDGTILVGTDEDSWQLLWGLDRLYAADYSAPDLLPLHTEGTIQAGLFTFDGSAGDYFVDLYRTDGVEYLHLTQANNGDGILSSLLSGGTPETWKYDFVFTRARGAGGSASRLRGVSFTAVAVRCDDANGGLWLQKASVADQYEGGGSVWRPVMNAPCVRYPFADGVALPEDFSSCAVFTVAVDSNGEITALGAPES